ncbi:YdeI/OmpD-associated family protein [Paenibacillus sp. 1011MAR3C5]|uniref:YdeI/OmpD-associated family protein n=1 Tax=Paenibacillus sp. 1011MAR3C5 TaxID=1675787 RepID=UPI0015FFDF57|nr:YdeI/OmpD-associated family protein [Paenibacillus sp. 1011MAR3C5]
MKFKTEVILGGKTATGFEVPSEVVESLGKGKKPPVVVTISGYSYRSTVAVMGGKFMLPLNSDNRQQAGVAAGDIVEVELALDTEPREIVVPEDLAAALAQEETAAAFFAGLSYSNKNRIVYQIEQAKTAETRDRRIRKAVETLKEGNV